jgi:hypothetical protein
MASQVKDAHSVADEGALGAQILNYFYPVHYQLGMELELAMGQGRVGRRQAALLWLVHSTTRDGQWVTRKAIEAQLERWFDLGAPGVSKLIRDVSSGEAQFVECVASPQSGREKVIRLTIDGEKFVETMAETARSFIEHRLSHMSPQELSWGLGFFQRAFG